MALQLPDTRALSDEVSEAFRLRAVAAHQAGFSETTIAAILGVLACPDFMYQAL